jgi:hypothetical protein
VADDGHGDVEVLGRGVEGGEGVGVAARAGLGDDAGDRVAGLGEQLVDGGLDVLGADASKGTRRGICRRVLRRGDGGRGRRISKAGRRASWGGPWHTCRPTMTEQPASVTALLGPTNTGKTHQAIVRCSSTRSGMIGLPLRLLAREVYDRCPAQVGEAAVALITGEEKRVPPRPRYWVCTTESMPIDRDVDFMAIDEIQLAAHRERGHVFTDRLLRAARSRRCSSGPTR